MEALQYRSTVWICRLLCQDSVIPHETCPPMPLFVFMMNRQATWSCYTVYTTWLHHFPSQGRTVFTYLKTHYPDWMYSFSYLTGQYILCHVAKTLSFLC